MKMPRSLPLTLLMSLLVVACGGGGGGGGGNSGNPKGGATSAIDAEPVTDADLEVITYATTAVDSLAEGGGSNSSFGRVDLVDGGVPRFNPKDLDDPDAVQEGDLDPNPAKRAFLDRLMTTSGIDLDGDLLDTNFDGIGDTGFDTYETGLNPGNVAGRTIGANNLYDLFQTSTGQPILDTTAYAGGATPGGPPFTGGDGNGDGIPDGGPGLFSNLAGLPNVAAPPVPRLPVLPNTMGAAPGTSGRGPSPEDEHQFIQIVFPYKLDPASLFNPPEDSNPGDGIDPPSERYFLGDSTATNGQNPNTVLIERRWISHPSEADQINVVDNTFGADQVIVPCVGIIGGVSSVPLVLGQTALTTVDLSPANLSNLPEGCRALVGKPNVLTLIAHENPFLIEINGDRNVGQVLGDGTLILPDPTDGDGFGGRVFGGDEDVPGSVNDFATDGDTPAANEVGFISVNITRLRKADGTTINRPYFHTFPVDQSNVGADPRAVNGSFDRGPAIVVNPITQDTSIDVLHPNADILSSTPNPTSDTDTVISSRSRFLIEFDKEVVPNSVGFSRRHTIQAVAGQGVVFPYNGNTRPIASPADFLLPGTVGAPLAPSVFLAVNQDASVAVNNLFTKRGTNVYDSGDTFDADPTIPGLSPPSYNTLASLPRGVVPCDIYPLNQNNLQAYVLQPLLELPPGSVVTVGVCRQGLGMSQNVLPQNPGLPFPPGSTNPFTNHGNFTVSGTQYAQFQTIDARGLGDQNLVNDAIRANRTIIKVNAGPMDLTGQLFFGSTDTSQDTLIDGDVQVGQNVASNDLTDGGFNVCRTFQVGSDNEDVYVNAPVSPQAMYVGYGSRGVGVIDMSGTGFNTNVPGGAQANIGAEDYLVVSRSLPPLLSAGTISLPSIINWISNGSLVANNHVRAYGITSRYVAGFWFDNAPTSTSPTGIGIAAAFSAESELAEGRAIPTGRQTPTPGVNEGSSGFQSIVRDSAGNKILTDEAVEDVTDIVVGDFLDSVFFDSANPFAGVARRRTFVVPLQPAVDTNTIADPPAPNPPPLRYPVGLPLTSILFDQSDLTRDPFVIEGNEVFTSQNKIFFQDGTGIITGTTPVNSLIQLNPTSNATNNLDFDTPHLPNAGFNNPFTNDIQLYVQTGPMPKTATAGASVLTQTFLGSPVPVDTGGIIPPIYQSRQQIGNFLFVADNLNKKVHAINSNTFRTIASIDLPDPFGLGLTADLETLYVSNQGDDSVSVVDVDPRNPTFMTEIARVPVGDGPRAVSAAPDNEDVFVLNRQGNTVSIIDIGTNTVRRTLNSQGLNRPNDVTLGMREVTGGPAFQSGTYHGYISNGGGNNVLIYESGPAGVAGIGFDNIIAAVAPNFPVNANLPDFVDMVNPLGIVYDPRAPLDSFAGTVGCFVAHQDPQTGRAVVSRVAYQADSSPGQNVFNTNDLTSAGNKVFEVRQQYQSEFNGRGLDVALLDYNRNRLEVSDFVTTTNLFNSGSTFVQPGGLFLPRNTKYPFLTGAGVGGGVGGSILTTARWDPDRLYLLVEGGTVDVFDLIQPDLPVGRIEVGPQAAMLATYFSQ